MRSLTRMWLVEIPLLGCGGCDQITKGAARAYLTPGVTESFFHDILRLTYTENPGAFLSVGASLPEHTRAGIFVVAVGLLSLAFLGAAIFARGLDRWQTVSMSLLAGGGLSNVADRLTNDGRVTDFLNVGLGSVRTGIFNIADVAIMIGVTLLFLTSRDAASRTFLEHSRDG